MGTPNGVPKRVQESHSQNLLSNAGHLGSGRGGQQIHSKRGTRGMHCIPRKELSGSRHSRGGKMPELTWRHLEPEQEKEREREREREREKEREREGVKERKREKQREHGCSKQHCWGQALFQTSPVCCLAACMSNSCAGYEKGII